jgi:hypothetical protein
MSFMEWKAKNTVKIWRWGLSLTVSTWAQHGHQGVVKKENIIFYNMCELILVELYKLKAFQPSECFENGGGQ